MSAVVVGFAQRIIQTIRDSGHADRRIHGSIAALITRTIHVVLAFCGRCLASMTSRVADLWRFAHDALHVRVLRTEQGIIRALHIAFTTADRGVAKKTRSALIAVCALDAAARDVAELSL